MFDPSHNPVQRSRLFTVYNRERAKHFFERKRLNKALGLLQRRDQSWRTEYQTTLKWCGCRDSMFRQEEICKHRIALAIESLVMEDLNREAQWVLDNLSALKTLVTQEA